MADRTCTVPECSNPPRSARADWCKKHYHRWYRHGSVDYCARTAGITASAGRRYRTTYKPGHPVAGANGNAYVHRVVLYDKIGPGEHSCHWCGATVRWTSTRGDADCLQVDHLNGIGDDNHPDNLVPACPVCNTTRGGQARSRALRQAGWWSHHDTIANLRNGGRVAEIQGS